MSPDPACVRRSALPLLLWILGLGSLAGEADAQPHLDGLFYYRPPGTKREKVMQVDVLAYGGTPAGVTAATQAARMGRKAVLVSFNGHVGGLTSGGLTATDIGDQKSIGGLADEFYRKLGSIKDFSPGKAEQVLLTMLQQAGVEVILHAPLESVAMEEGSIVSATMVTGLTVRAKVFIDATYEGDLLAAAGVSHHVGREPRSACGELLAGQWQQVSWKGVYQFCGLPVSPYRNPGDPGSGLLPGMSSDPSGEPGQGDYRIQAYNFRMFLSDKPGAIPFPKPWDYDPDRYALLGRFLNADPEIQWALNYTTRPMTDGPMEPSNR